MIYWSGLERWGIKRRRGTREQWARSRGARPPSPTTAIGQRVVLVARQPFEPPPGFPEGRVARLSVAGGASTSRADRDLAARAHCSPGLVERRAPWTGSGLRLGACRCALSSSRITPRLVDHAQRFSEAMHGAALLYNLVLAEATKDDEAASMRYRAALDVWRGLDCAQWDVDDFWPLLGDSSDPATIARARRFVDATGSR